MISKPVILRAGEYKCRIFEMHLKLRDQKPKNTMYIIQTAMLDVMVTTKQKPKMDMHTKKRNDSKQH